MSALLGCPFCGCVTSAHNDTDSPLWFAGCGDDSCEVQPHVYEATEAEAIAAWNRRAQPAAPAVDARMCLCKDRPLSACPGEWEPGCDLGNNPAFVRRSPDAAPSVVEPRTALQRFESNIGTEDCTPIERLRFFCSLAMRPQDWLDEEAFFDAMTEAHPPRAPLTGEQIDAMWRVSYRDRSGGGECSFDWFEAGIRALEAAHGIAADRGAAQ